MSAERSNVLVYGATGLTGQRVCAALLEQGASVCAVARDLAKLDALQSTLGTSVRREAAALDDADRLSSLMRDSQVVLNCVGPFARHGRAVQDAALAAGRHCLDLAGEPQFVRETLARDAEAKQRDVLLASGVGFDVAPTDALAMLVAARAGPQIHAVRVAYSSLDAEPTTGLGLTMLTGLLDGGLAFVDGELRREPFGQQGWKVPFRGPAGSTFCTSVPWGDVASLPHSTGARTVRAYLPRPPLSPAPARAMLCMLRRLLSAAKFDAVSQRVARRLAAALPTKGNAHAAVVEVTGSAGTVTGWLTAPGGIAARSAAHCARRACASDFATRGAHTPGTAFGARSLIDELGAYGLAWGLD